MPRPDASCWANADSAVRRPPPRSLTTMVAVAMALAAMVAVMVTSPVAVGAETPNEIIAELETDGVFVARSRADNFDEQAMRQSVERARAQGLRLIVAAPVDPQPDAVAFARRILEAGDADAAVLFPPEGSVESFVIEDFESARFRALAAARSKSEGAAAIDAFVEELLTTPAQPIPDIVRQLVLIMLGLAVVLAVLVIIETLLRPRRRRKNLERYAAEGAVDDATKLGA